MNNDFLVFGQPLIEVDEIDEVNDSLKKAWLGTGPKVHQFEEDFAKYKGLKYAAAVNSCTAALHLSCLSLGLGPGDEVITTAMTFCASVNAILHAGAVPVIADIEPHTLNVTAETIEKKISKRSKAILVVHYAGRVCPMAEIMDIAKKYDLKVIEDCAHAIESELDGVKAGAFGDIAAFSFYATKNIVTGEGGMILSNNEELISRCRVLALHGMSKDAWARFSDSGYKHYQVVECGYKYNMMDLQAALGIHQLKRVEGYWLRRKEIWDMYQKAFSHIANIGLPLESEDNSRHAYHLYTIRIEDGSSISRDAFLEEMTKKKIGVGVHYLAICEHPYYQKELGLKPDDYPNATKYGRETVSLPLSPKLSNSDVSRVIDAVTSILNG